MAFPGVDRARHTTKMRWNDQTAGAFRGQPTQDADPQDKAAAYQGLSLVLTCQPASRTIHANAQLTADWVAALTPISVDGMIVAASTTLLAESRTGGHGGFLPWALLVVGSAASLAANVAVAEPTAIGRVVAAWPSSR